MSSIPAAIDHLVARLPVVLPAGMQVIDGPPGVELLNDGVTIGYTPDEISVRAEIESGGLGKESETYDISCLVWARSGDGNQKAVRDRAFSNLGAIDVFLDKDPHLGGAVVHARLRVLEVDQLHNSDGIWVAVAFAITCTAFK